MSSSLIKIAFLVCLAMARAFSTVDLREPQHHRPGRPWLPSNLRYKRPSGPGVIWDTRHTVGTPISDIRSPAFNGKIVSIKVLTPSLTAERTRSSEHVSSSEAEATRVKLQSSTAAAATSSVKSQSSTQASEEALSEFFGELRGHIVDRFDPIHFETKIPELTCCLSHAKDKVRALTSPNTTLSKQVDFAGQMLEFLVFASQKLQRYDNPRRTDHIFINSMIGLHIRLYALCDNEGRLNYSLEGYANKVINAWMQMCLLSDDFKDLDGVSLIANTFFWDRKEEAEKMIDELWAQIPDEEGQERVSQESRMTHNSEHLTHSH